MFNKEADRKKWEALAAEELQEQHKKNAAPTDTPTSSPQTNTSSQPASVLVVGQNNIVGENIKVKIVHEHTPRSSHRWQLVLIVLLVLALLGLLAWWLEDEQTVAWENRIDAATGEIITNSNLDIKDFGIIKDKDTGKPILRQLSDTLFFQGWHLEFEFAAPPKTKRCWLFVDHRALSAKGQTTQVIVIVNKHELKDFPQPLDRHPTQLVEYDITRYVNKDGQSNMVTYHITGPSGNGTDPHMLVRKFGVRMLSSKKIWEK